MLLLAAQTPPLTIFEKTPQRGGVRLVGAQLDMVDVRGAKELLQFSLAFNVPQMERFAPGAVCGVDLDDLSAFSILEDQSPERRKLLFKAVNDLHRHDIVAPIRLAQGGIRCVRQARRSAGSELPLESRGRARAGLQKVG